MTTWTMDQVYAVKRLHATMHLDTELVDRHGEAVVNEAEREMAKHLRDMAHPLGVDLALVPEHYEIAWEVDPNAPWQSIGRMRWGPQVKTIELRGGHCDGQRLDFERVGDPIRIPRTSAPAGPAQSIGPAQPVVTADTYEIAGWREDAGAWVYEARQ